ncbi:uncharacterized protein LOC113325865 [Papaver somniferum]|uniref:uncharacterized protein LOC113325865 n=1 Tax=Papaver somniferum TaxID=3469 RepID=UPI000E702A08|nr:uncharacterized protein LOC113325865 [Papaver somniferum]
MAIHGVISNSTNPSFLEQYNVWLQGDTNSTSMALAATKCWFVWKERCLRVFEKKERTPEQLAVDIARHYNYWHPHSSSINLHKHSKNTAKNIQWIFPSRDIIKLNCDASWVSKNTNAGFGFVLRNWLGTGKGAGMGIFRASTAEEAEALTLLHTTR